jgi:hypothetical protein
MKPPTRHQQSKLSLFNDEFLLIHFFHLHKAKKPQCKNRKMILFDLTDHMEMRVAQSRKKQLKLMRKANDFKMCLSPSDLSTMQSRSFAELVEFSNPIWRVP